MVNGQNKMIPGYISPLELLHPDGIARRSIVLGSNCPTLLLPNSCQVPADHADFALLAPTDAECRVRGWLEERVRMMAHKIAPDGIIYVLVPRRLRLRIMSLLRQYGLSVGPLIAHLPDWGLSRYLLPLNPIPAQYAFSKLLPIGPPKRHLAMMAFRFPGGENLLARMLPSVGLVARRPSARPLFNWLFNLGSEVHPPGSAIVCTGWRRQSGTAVLYRFSDGDAQPSTVAKMSLMTTLAVKDTNEAALINQLGPAARRAGARVPQPLFVEQINGHRVLLETAVSGQSLAALLAFKPSRLFDLMEHVTSWLERWNGSTKVIRSLDIELLNQELLAPAALLAPLLEQGEEYRQWLTIHCATATGIPVPLVATHNDLTMSNVLLDGQGSLGIVDWETCREEAFPLVDFFYAMADAVAATRGYTDRPKAFEACFSQGGIFAGAVARLHMRLMRSLEIPADVADLCFHACWLQHAADEHRVNEPSTRRRFLKIVQWLALHRSLLFRP
jgi:hypothetical protein